MELTFLGTGAGSPSRYRNVTSSVLNLQAERGSAWMFDCGEGTQHRILTSPVKMGKIDKLFITHLHGDHIFGIPGLLSSRSCQVGPGVKSFAIYGPKGIAEFIKSALRLSQSRIGYEIVINEIEEGVVFEDELFRVEAGHVNHRIECFGYRIVEKDKPGKLDAVRLKEMGAIPGPAFAQLKLGGQITLPDGTVVDGKDFLGPPLKGRIVTIAGDTRYSKSTLKLARNADLLVHEATFSHELKEMAEDYGHSTAVQAAELAAEAGVKRLVLTHISSRYQGKEEILLEQAQGVFPHVSIAADYDTEIISRF
ncbi:ribonuclease Z [Gorillibacterium massiliense]|uniref:ribonuclease Z n=1 Tax=Gorillibacterium massiliense TaxID=1280390 RepID=UPI000593445D|nr:ribonuclease Z [Gorillibacterium massiliense]